MLRRDQVEFFGNKASLQLQHTKTLALKLLSEQLLAWADVSVMALRWLCCGLWPFAWGPPTPMFCSALPHVVVPRHPFLPIGRFPHPALFFEAGWGDVSLSVWRQFWPAPGARALEQPENRQDLPGWSPATIRPPKIQPSLPPQVSLGAASPPVLSAFWPCWGAWKGWRQRTFVAVLGLCGRWLRALESS